MPKTDPPHETATVVVQKPEPPRKRVFPQGYNFAMYQHGATIAGGCNNILIIDGVSTGHDWCQGYGYSCWAANPPEPFLITLREPTTIDCVRFLLWDLDGRFQRYKVEVCADDQAKAWTLVADRTGPKEECRGWQVSRFAPQTVKLIRLTGTFNSVNPSFYVVELQASLGLPSETQPVEPAPDF
jgi:hypothetical protein